MLTALPHKNIGSGGLGSRGALLTVEGTPKPALSVCHPGLKNNLVSGTLALIPREIVFVFMKI
jgi:hypothetical protein